MVSNKELTLSEICGTSLPLIHQRVGALSLWQKSCSSRQWLKPQVHFRTDGVKTHFKRDGLKLGDFGFSITNSRKYCLEHFHHLEGLHMS